jgi:hypothetical protein
VVEQDERGLFGFSVLAARHVSRTVRASGRAAGTDRSRSYPCRESARADGG